VITSINGQTIKSNSELRNAIGLSRVGDKLAVALIRDRKPITVTAVITEPPTASNSAAPRGNSGSAGESTAIHPGLEGATLADAAGGGVEVRAVEPRSVAAGSLRKGDKIEGVNRQTIGNLKELREAAKRGGTLVLRIRRGNALVLAPLRAP
jgi:S1-C subfamily serine protease